MIEDNASFDAIKSSVAASVRDPTTRTILQHDGPNHLGLRCNAALCASNGSDRLGCAQQAAALKGIEEDDSERDAAARADAEDSGVNVMAYSCFSMEEKFSLQL